MKIVPVLGEADRWWVWSETRPGVVYIVDRHWLDGDTGYFGWGCACERFLADGAECKHIKAVKKMLKRWNLKPET